MFLVREPQVLDMHFKVWPTCEHQQSLVDSRSVSLCEHAGNDGDMGQNLRYIISAVCGPKITKL